MSLRLLTYSASGEVVKKISRGSFSERYFKSSDLAFAALGRRISAHCPGLSNLYPTPKPSGLVRVWAFGCLIKLDHIRLILEG
jgi:hypothetical protein